MNKPNTLSRRAFLNRGRVLAAAAIVTQTLGIVDLRRCLASEPAAAPDLLRETFEALLAFVLPGNDAHAQAQGLALGEPGGVEANVTEAMIETLNLSQPLVPGHPPFAGIVAAILNGIALEVNPAGTAVFSAPFARLTFAEKATVFAFMEGHPTTEGTPLRLIAGLLPGLAAFLIYSEAGVWDPTHRTVTSRPLGWTLSGYEGVAEGRDEFRGYFQNRRAVTGGDYA